jgi:type I restriction enzyme S subunit
MSTKINNGWERKRIGEVAIIKPPKSEARERVPPDALVSFVPMEDLGISTKYPEPKQTKRLSEVVGSYTYFADGDVLLAKITPCFENGKVGIAKDLENGVGFGSSEFFVLRPDCIVSNEWLFHFLSREDFRQEGALRMSGAVGHKRVPKEFLESCEIPVPPIPEQQRIVGVLDEAFEGLATAKANAEKNLQNARALFESHLHSVFTKRGKGWVETTIGEEIRFIDYRGKTPVKTASGIRLITAKNVKMGYLLDTPMEFIAADNYESWMTRGIPKKGDVLFTTEAPLANVAQLDTDEKVAFAQRIIIMQPNAVKLDATFLKYLLLSQPVQERIRGKGTGATVQGIKASLLKTIEISFPNNIAEQKQIAAKLHGLAAETQRLAAIYEQKLAALEALKKSLLHQAFSGNL